MRVFRGVIIVLSSSFAVAIFAINGIYTNFGQSNNKSLFGILKYLRCFNPAEMLRILVVTGCPSRFYFLFMPKIKSDLFEYN